jgi:hypothetical protein
MHHGSVEGEQVRENLHCTSTIVIITHKWLLDSLSFIKLQLIKDFSVKY